MQLTPHFALVEFSCRDGTPVPQDLIPNVSRLALQLEALRKELMRPVLVVSGYRTPAWNRRVGGAAKSQHLTGRAADLRVAGVEPVVLHATVLRLIGKGRMHDGGLGLYPSFVHYDVRDRRVRWQYGLGSRGV